MQQPLTNWRVEDGIIGMLETLQGMVTTHRLEMRGQASLVGLKDSKA